MKHGLGPETLGENASSEAKSTSTLPQPRASSRASQTLSPACRAHAHWGSPHPCTQPFKPSSPRQVCLALATRSQNNSPPCLNASGSVADDRPGVSALGERALGHGRVSGPKAPEGGFGGAAARVGPATGNGSEGRRSDSGRARAGYVLSGLRRLFLG